MEKRTDFFNRILWIEPHAGNDAHYQRGPVFREKSMIRPSNIMPYYFVDLFRHEITLQYRIPSTPPRGFKGGFIPESQSSPDVLNHPAMRSPKRESFEEMVPLSTPPLGPVDSMRFYWHHCCKQIKQPVRQHITQRDERQPRKTPRYFCIGTTSTSESTCMTPNAPCRRYRKRKRWPCLKEPAAKSANRI